MCGRAARGSRYSSSAATRAQLLITGNDEKVSFDENTGKTITHPAGKDTVSIIDIADPAKPKIVVNLPLMNTITGPPVNLAITPDQHLALVANSLDWIKDGDAWKGLPDNKIYVIDLTTSPPQQIGTVEAGKQASGMAINHAGTLAAITGIRFGKIVESRHRSVFTRSREVAAISSTCGWRSSMVIRCFSFDCKKVCVRSTTVARPT